jgi:hypothetical protein
MQELSAVALAAQPVGQWGRFFTANSCSSDKQEVALHSLAAEDKGSVG